MAVFISMCRAGDNQEGRHLEIFLFYRRGYVSKCRMGLCSNSLEGPLFQYAEWNVFIFLEVAIFQSTERGGSRAVLVF